MSRGRRAVWISVLGVGAGVGIAAAASGHEPRVLYMLHCQGCHRPDGVGTPGAVPPLDGWMGRFLTVSGGREYLVRVPGSSQAPISDAELASLLNWMVRRFGPESVAREFRPFTADEVTSVRRPPLTDVAAYRRELLVRMGGPGGPDQPGVSD